MLSGRICVPIILLGSSVLICGCKAKSSAPESAVEAREVVTTGVTRDDSSRISAYGSGVTPPSTQGLPDAPSGATDSAHAVNLIQRYYHAIDARDYRQAYELWDNAGAASRQALDEFTKGFAQTAHVEVTTLKPGRIGAAAGSRYIDVPVAIKATMTSGASQLFSGRYTLRRSVVDGASAGQRQWRIYSASIHSAPVRTPRD